MEEEKFERPEERSLFIRVIDEELESHLPIDHMLIQPSHTPAYAADPRAVLSMKCALQ